MLRRGRGYRDHEYLLLKVQKAAASRRLCQTAQIQGPLQIPVKIGKTKRPLDGASLQPLERRGAYESTTWPAPMITHLARKPPSSTSTEMSATIPGFAFRMAPPN